MALNIKDPRVHDMVKQIAELTWSSQAAAVGSAVEAYLEQLLRQEKTERILAIGRDAAQRMAANPLPPNVDEILGYDEVGLPR